MSLLHSSINPDFIDYLLAADFTFHRSTRWSGDFVKGRILVTINHLKVDIVHTAEPFQYGATQRTERVHSFTGIDRLDLYGWAQLLDLTGVIFLKDIIADLPSHESRELLRSISTRLLTKQTQNLNQQTA